MFYWLNFFDKRESFALFSAYYISENSWYLFWATHWIFSLLHILVEMRSKYRLCLNILWKVLLVASSFMTPVESRNETNRNSVRMFGPEKLNKSVAAQKWDRVKIVCTQPFNKVSLVKFKNFSTLHTCISILISIYHSLIYTNTLLLVFEVELLSVPIQMQIKRKWIL